MKTLNAFRFERWDQLCYRAYSNVSQTLLLELRGANRHLSSSMSDFKFQGGELVTIPDIEVEAALESIVEEPPWAR